MIRITIRPPVKPVNVLRATGKKTYRDGENAYCLNVRTVGELETTANLLKEAGIDIQSAEDI